MPASRLEQVLAELEAAILTRVAGVVFRFGARYVAAQDVAPPRVVWVRATDVYGDPPDAGVNAETDAVATRAAVVVAHVWGAADAGRGWSTDDAAAEAVVDAVVAALLDVLGPSATPSAGEWVEDEHLARGAVCLLSFTVYQPVPRLPEGAVVRVPVEATAFDPTGAAAGDGTLQAGES